MKINSFLWRNILRKFKLALCSDYDRADDAWIIALNYIDSCLMDKNVSMSSLKLLIKLLVRIDDGHIEMYLEDWKNDVVKNKEYKARLNVICPIINKEVNKYKKELADFINEGMKCK